MSDSEYSGADKSSRAGEAYDFKQTLNVSPRDKAHGWAPFIWLAYLSFFFIQPILDHAGWKMWSLTALATAIFLVLYFGLFWLQKPRSLLHIAGMVILGQQ